MKLNRLFFSVALILIFASQMFAQSGKIAGKVLDKETGEGLPFANVMIDGTTMGAATDIEGRFTILNIQPGVYSVTASIVGYQKQQITDVRVNVDFTTNLEFELSTGSIEMEAVVVQGERNPLIRQDLTNPTVAITTETIDELPVDQISDVIRMQAGVVVGNDGSLHFRGGYGNEVAYTLNGVSLNDPFGNSRSIGLATNAVQEVSVSTGTFSAEYGNALSGVVNYVTKEGSDKYTFSLRAYGGDYVTSQDDIFEHLDDIDPLNRKRAEFTFGGPIPGIKKLKLFVSGVYEDFGGSRYGQRLFNPTDSYLSIGSNATTLNEYRNNVDENRSFYFNPYDPNSEGLPTGDGEWVALNDSRSYNFQANLSYAITPTLKIKYESVYDNSEYKSNGDNNSYTQFSARYNPDGRGTRYTEGIHNAVEFTHTVSDNLFYTLKGSYTINSSDFYLYEDMNDPRYVPGSIYAKTLENTSFYTGGTNNERTNRETKATGFKGDMLGQFGKHEIKLGFEARLFEIFYESYTLQFQDANGDAATTAAALAGEKFYAYKPTNPGSFTSYTNEPTQLAVYLRDKIELDKSLILNLGVRYEYFDPAANFNPVIADEFRSRREGGLLINGLEEATVKHMVSPRFSVSYPISDQGLIRFSYGHFYQNGSLSSLYRNPSYYYAPASGRPTFGNADVDPQKSVQYEMGLTQGLTEDLRLEVTGFSKDVNDYIGYSTVYTTAGQEYRVLTNQAYSNVKGITISFFKRRSNEGMFQASLDYTFQVANGVRTEPSEDLFFSEATEYEAPLYLVPLAFDRSHIINSTINLIDPGNWTAGITAYLQTGTPYTPSLPANMLTTTYEQNEARRPVQWNVNLKFEKYFELGSLKYSLFVQVENLFDLQREISVYTDTGKALSSLSESQNPRLFDTIRNAIRNGDPGLFDESVLDNYYRRSTNLGSPREIKVGFSVMFN